MSTNALESGETDPHAPFGAGKVRSRMAVVFWGVLYGLWFLILLWMAAFTAGK